MNKELLNQCVGNDLKDIKLRNYLYDNLDSQLIQLILKFEDWICITIEDDHVSIKPEKGITDLLTETVELELSDSSPELNTFRNKKLKNFYTITNDSRFAFGICFEFFDKSRFIFANRGYDNEGNDSKEIIVE